MRPITTDSVPPGSAVAYLSPSRSRLDAFAGIPCKFLHAGSSIPAVDVVAGRLAAVDVGTDGASGRLQAADTCCVSIGKVNLIVFNGDTQQ